MGILGEKAGRGVDASETDEALEAFVAEANKDHGVTKRELSAREVRGERMAALKSTVEGAGSALKGGWRSLTEGIGGKLKWLKGKMGAAAETALDVVVAPDVIAKRAVGAAGEFISADARQTLEHGRAAAKAVGEAAGATRDSVVGNYQAAKFVGGMAVDAGVDAARAGASKVGEGLTNAKHMAEGVGSLAVAGGKALAEAGVDAVVAGGKAVGKKAGEVAGSVRDAGLMAGGLAVDAGMRAGKATVDAAGRAKDSVVYAKDRVVHHVGSAITDAQDAGHRAMRAGKEFASNDIARTAADFRAAKDSVVHGAESAYTAVADRGRQAYEGTRDTIQSAWDGFTAWKRAKEKAKAEQVFKNAGFEGGVEEVRAMKEKLAQLEGLLKLAGGASPDRSNISV